ncbi:MAG: hypothetical protein ACKOTB_16410, partial [Planctomycetia bacterium]
MIRSFVLCAAVVLSGMASLPAAEVATSPAATNLAGVMTPWLEDGSLAGAVVLVTDRDRTLVHEAAG